MNADPSKYAPGFHMQRNNQEVACAGRPGTFTSLGICTCEFNQIWINHTCLCSSLAFSLSRSLWSLCSGLGPGLSPTRERRAKRMGSLRGRFATASYSQLKMVSALVPACIVNLLCCVTPSPVSKCGSTRPATGTRGGWQSTGASIP